jgi:hypothetical protein
VEKERDRGKKGGEMDEREEHKDKVTSTKDKAGGR